MQIKRIGKIIFVIFLFLLFAILLWILNDNRQMSLKDNQEIKNIDASNFLPVRHFGKNDYFWGNKNAPIELIVYNDLSCLFCTRFNQVIEKIKKEFPKQVKIVYRHFPLDNNQDSLYLANAVECAGEQQKFMEMYQGIMSLKKTKKTIQELITELNLDKSKFNQCLTNHQYQDKIINQKKEAKNFGVLGAPSSFLNGQSLPGAYQFNDFKDQHGYKYLGLKNLILQKLNQQ